MRRVFAHILLFVITVALGYAFLESRTHEIIPGATTFELVGRCDLTFYDTRLQAVDTVTFGCPRMDSIRLWPLPIQHPWFEDDNPRHKTPRIYIDA